MNDDSRYKVTFMGQIVAGESIEQVKQNLSRLFKSSAANIDRLFSGKSIIIKKGISEAEAKSYQQAMHKAGAIADITLWVVVEEINYSSDLPPPPQINDPDDDLSPPPPAEITNAADPLGIAPADQWKIDPVGVRMSKPKKVRTKPMPITDHLQLSPPKSEVGQAKHKIEAIAPDISQLDIDEIGAQLSDKNIKEKPTAPNVSHLNLAAVGENMGQAIHNKELIEPDISQYNIAEAGTDMGQLSKEKKLLNPDTSHLNLVED